MTAEVRAAWLGFLASPAAPKTAMSLLELDGYLTGIVVAPRAAPILPSRWLPALWGQEEPIFEDDAQIKTVLGAVMEHHNAIIAALDKSLKRLETDRVCDYRPMFLHGDGKPSPDAVRSWVRGFWKAMALVPESWSALAEDERLKVLIQPFVSFIDLGNPELIERSDNIAEILDEDAASIPRTVLVLRKLARLRAARAPARHRQIKIGRNDPCPCGSGQKYKRCCGTD